MELFLALFRSFMMFLFIQGFEAEISFQQKPGSPQNVTEGGNVTLSWSYIITGTLQQAQLRRIYADKSEKVIVNKFTGNNPTITGEFQDRFHVQIISDTQASLTITGIPRSDSGMYSYQITDDSFDVKPSVVEISVLYKPNITTFVTGNQTVNESDPLILKCAADGNPKPSITWTRLSDSSTINPTLNITGKHVEGGYKCTASNSVGNPDSRTVYIIVKNHHPIDTIVTTNLTDNTVVVNTTFSVTCSATARPSAKYRFYKGNEVVNDTDSNGVITTSVNERVKKVDYSCVPYNFYGTGRKEVVTVAVHYSPADTRLTSKATNATVLRGDSLLLNCSTDANPTAHVYSLYFNGHSFGNSSSGFFNITVEEDGVYTCLPLNVVGTGDNDTLNVSVVFAPVIDHAPPAYQVLEQRGVILFCNATGSPQPSITWTKQGNASKWSTSETLNLTKLKREDDGSVYKCTATNSVGSAQALVKITVLSAPDIDHAPSAYQVVEGGSVILFCNATGNPKPNITWTKQGNSSMLSSSETLNLEDVTREDDESVYTCGAKNSRGSVQTTVNVTVLYPPSVTIHESVVTALKDSNVTLTCSVSGNPKPIITWKEMGRYEVLSNTSSYHLVNVRKPGTTDNMIQYQCTASNGVGTPATATVNVTVYYRPVDTNFTTENTTVLRRSHFTLKCSTDASPTAEFRLYLNGSFNETNNSGTFYVIAVSDAEYTCVPRNLYGEGENATVKVTVVDAPLALLSPVKVTANENDTLNLTCTVFGKPKPSIKWSKDGSSYVPCNDSLCTVTVSRHGAVNDVIQYQCTASNGVGTPYTATASITVHYPAMITEPGNVTLNVTVGNNVNFSCNGTGNPKPIIRLVAIFGEASNRKNVSESNSFEAKPDSAVRFLCTVENALAKKVKWIHLVLNAMEFEVTLTIINKACRDNPDEVVKQLREHVIEILKKWNIPIEHITTITYKCGSVTVYLSLIFSQNVEIENVLTVLKKASTEERGFGDLKVDPESIQAISPERIPTTPTPTPVDLTTEERPTGPKCKESFVPESNCPLSVAFIVFLVVLAVILFSVTFAIIIYCLYKRRKCRKDSRVHSTQSEERPFSPSNENDYSQVNSGYAETGPRSTERANLDRNQGEEGAAVIPTYAVVDKSKKKGRKKDKKAAGMKPTEDQYAVVDKSKKKTKLKNEPDATYAEVDLQKKSKKKPKPGEVLYADLGEFHQMKKMPEVSTSPKALPPIKWPEASAETQYADITQFLKGNSEDPGAELPKESTTPAVSNTATGSKEESSAGNAGDSAEAANETGF